MEGLGLIGIFDLDPAVNANNALNPGINLVRDVKFALACLNGAYQECYRLGPIAMSEDRYADVLRPPTNVTFTATQYSKVISGFATWAAWMEECTFRCSGDDLDNEIQSETLLRTPYMGASGTVSATVHADALKLPTTVANIMEPVELANKWPLRAAGSRDLFRSWTQPQSYGSGRSDGAAYYTTQQKSIGEPTVFLVDSVANNAAAALPIYLRLNPIPNQAYRISMRVKKKPPTFAVADIYGASYADPAGVVPVEWNESIILPFFLKRFLRHPTLNNPAAAAEIRDQYAAAKIILESLTPQNVAQTAIYAN